MKHMTKRLYYGRRPNGFALGVSLWRGWFELHLGPWYFGFEAKQC